jgi:hypothetical protein
MAIGIDDALRLVKKILVDSHATTELHTMIRPRRTLGLQIDAYPVGSSESGLRRAIAMETHMVEPILLALQEDAQPLGLVSGRKACKGETAVLDCATKEEWTPVDEQLTPIDGDLTHAKHRLIDIVARLNGELIKVWRKLVPQLQHATEVKLKTSF